MTIIIVIRLSRLLIVVRIVTTIMHSSQTDDHQVWTSTVLRALYPPVYLYCTAISSPCLFLWSNIVLHPLHLLYLLFLSLSLCCLLIPLLITISWKLGYSHTHTLNHTALQAEAPGQWWTHSFSTGYGWKDIVHSHIFCWSMTSIYSTSWWYIMSWYSYFISHSNLFFMQTVVLQLIYTAAVFTPVGGWWGLSLLQEGCILPVRLCTNNIPLRHTPGLPSKAFCGFLVCDLGMKLLL